MSTNQIEDDENELDFALDEDMSPNISSEEGVYILSRACSYFTIKF
jgi:hypothetical protein